MDTQDLAHCEHFACLVFADIKLLIPQSDIYSLEPSVDMTTSIVKHGIGQLEQGGTTWTLYALSSRLEILTICPDSYHVAVLMKNTASAYGLLCEQIYTVTRRELSIHAIPAAMQNTKSPLLALAVIGDQIQYISAAAVLARFFLMDAPK